MQSSNCSVRSREVTAVVIFGQFLPGFLFRSDSHFCGFFEGPLPFFMFDLFFP